MTEEFETLYQVVFFTGAAALVLMERVRAWQRQPVRLARRWTSNVGLFLIGTVCTAVVVPVGIYAFAQRQPPGLLSELTLPFAAQLVLTFLLLDFWRYWEHRWFHQVRLLWRFHLVHHSDTEIDVTTSERHHPVEFLLGTATMMALIAVLGLPAPAIGLYLLVATLVTLYSHANLRLPPYLDHKLGRLIVTPAVHAVHHSALQPQTDSNYGSVLTVWDRLFGTYIDPAVAQIRHFGLGYFHDRKDAGLARVLQQPFLYRFDFRYRERDDEPVDREAAAPSTTRRVDAAATKRVRNALVGGVLGCVMVTLAMWPAVLELTDAWRNSESYQFAWLVVPMVAYLLGWYYRQIGFDLDPRPDFSGVLVVLVAAACWGVATLMNVNIGRQFALVVALQGVAMSTLGWRSYWRLFPTLALMFLMIPPGDLLQPALRLLTLEAINLFAAVAHLPHSAEGFVIFIGAHRYIVVDECSGLAYVTLATFLGYSFGLLLYRSLSKVVALALFGAFLGIACNAMRVSAIVLIDWLRDSQMDLTAHGNIQWIALLAILGLLFYVLSRLRPEETPAVPLAAAPEQPNSLRRLAPVVAGLSMLLTVGSSSALATHEPRPRHEMQTGSFPKNIWGWDLADSGATWSIDEQEHTESITLSYHRNGRDIQVVIVDTFSPTAKLPESRLAPHDKYIWRDRQVKNELACVASNCIALRHFTWQRDKSEELRHVYYAYSIGKFTTNSRFALRAMHGWHRLTGGRDTPRLIGLVSEDAVPDIDELAGVFQILQAGPKD
jgi:exosortase